MRRTMPVGAYATECAWLSGIRYVRLLFLQNVRGAESRRGNVASENPSNEHGIRVYPRIAPIEQELPMTALTSIALLLLVVANGAMYASAMDEMAGLTASGLSGR